MRLVSGKLSAAPRGAGKAQVRAAAAYTLMEVVMAVALSSLFVIASTSAIIANQINTRKAKEQCIAMNFLTAYVEYIKALPFTSVAAGQPINYLYNGANGAPLIPIPTNTTPLAINTTAFLTFYPDLLWISNRNPTLQVNMTTNYVSGVLHDIHLNAVVQWSPALANGTNQQVEVDTLRTVDVPTL